VKAFASVFAWLIAVLSGLATLFALFGGQQWLEERGWTLAPPPSSQAPTEQVTATEDGTATADDATAPAGDPAASDEGLAWNDVLAWSEQAFANPLWGIVAIGVSMLIALAVGSLVAHATAPVSDVAAAFQMILALVCAAVIVLAGVLLHAADPGYLVWLVILAVISAGLGFFAPAFLSY
jgi:hypothetical protein